MPPKRNGYIRLAWSIVDDFGEAMGAAGWVYVALARYADRAGKCWPSIEKLAEKTGMGRNTVRRHIKTLCKLGLVRIDYGGLTARAAGRSKTRANFYQVIAPDRREGSQFGSLKGPNLEALRVPNWERNHIQMNKHHQPTAKHPPKITTGGPVFGGGGADSNLTQDAENIMRAFAACELKRYPHTLALAAKIAGYPHAPDVIEAEYAAVKGKSRNAAGALYARLNNMTPADWAARAPKARPVVRMKEIPE